MPSWRNNTESKFSSSLCHMVFMMVECLLSSLPFCSKEFIRWQNNKNHIYLNNYPALSDEVPSLAILTPLFAPVKKDHENL